MSAFEVELERAIRNLYRIDGTESVVDFQIDEASLEAILGEGASSGHRETLVVRESGEGVDLALFIAEEVRGQARAFIRAGEAGERALAHLDGFCAATEGVSHFVYVMFCGAEERPVSAIELELQAEIDKFLVLRVLAPLPGVALVEHLFDHFELDRRLNGGERERYTVANRAGRRYARWLDCEFAHGRGEHALRDARALYRKPLAAKLERIERAA